MAKMEILHHTQELTFGN